MDPCWNQNLSCNVSLCCRPGSEQKQNLDLGIDNPLCSDVGECCVVGNNFKSCPFRYTVIYFCYTQQWPDTFTQNYLQY